MVISDQRSEIADRLEAIFLHSYLGTNDQILNFARLLIARYMKTAAKELNRALSVLGNDVDPSVVINRISEKYLGEVAIGLAVQPTHRSGSHTVLAGIVQKAHTAGVEFIREYGRDRCGMKKRKHR